MERFRFNSVFALLLLAIADQANAFGSQLGATLPVAHYGSQCPAAGTDSMFVGQGLATADTKHLNIVADLKWLSLDSKAPLIALIGTLKSGDTYLFPYRNQQVFTIPGTLSGSIYAGLGRIPATSVAVTSAIRARHLLKPSYLTSLLVVHNCFDRPWNGKS